MALKTIKLSGFKSFAKKSVIDIDTPIVAIVGPNGSGKSNTAEAFRFALGEQSIKNMRGKKGEDLIWGGSDVVPRANRASVAIHFDNSRKFLDIDYDEVIIERVVHRDGLNEYFLNGSKVRLKDIITLLAGANIGASGHHIISQGEADRILNSTPKTRKLMLEEALGLRVYQYKKIESERKLQKTRENMREVGIKQRELMPRLKFLKREVEKKEQKQILENELKNKLIEFIARERIFIKEREFEIQEALKEPTQKIEHLKKEYEQILNQDSSSEKQENSKSELLSHIEILKNDTSLLKEKIQKIIADVGKKEGMIEVIKSSNERANQDKGIFVPLPKVKKIFDSILQKLSNMAHKKGFDILEFIAGVETEITNILSELEDNFSNTDKAKNTTNTKQLSLLTQEIEDLRNLMTSLSDELQNKENEIIKATEKLHNFEKTDEKRELELLRISTKIKDQESILKDIEYERRKIDDLKSSLDEYIQYAVEFLGKEARYIDDFKPEEKNREHQSSLRQDIERLRIRLDQIGYIDDEIVDEFNAINEKIEFLNNELEDLKKSDKKLEELIISLEDELEKRFTSGIKDINNEFNNFFNVLFRGGNAELKLVKISNKNQDEQESENEFGVEIMARLPRKKVSSLDALSGGERALVSIALIFAMSAVNPPPFIILDETDAALDEANSKRYADMVRELSKKSQLILITHNRETMSAAHNLYGITMGADGISRLLSVKLEDAYAVAK